MQYFPTPRTFMVSFFCALMSAETALADEYATKFCAWLSDRAKDSYTETYETRYDEEGYQGLILLDTQLTDVGPQDHYYLTRYAEQNWAIEVQLEVILNNKTGQTDSRQPYWENALSNFREWSDVAVEAANRDHLFSSAADLDWWNVVNAKSWRYARVVLEQCVSELKK